MRNLSKNPLKSKKVKSTEAMTKMHWISSRAKKMTMKIWTRTMTSRMEMRMMMRKTTRMTMTTLPHKGR
jgi:hypothetical protein